MQEAVETFQRMLMITCLASLAALAAALLLHYFRAPVSVVLGIVRRHPFKSTVLAPAICACLVYGSTKPVTPTVRGITLGSPMETPTQVSLTWQPDEGTSIGTNQLVHVFCRDADSPTWREVASGYGITNATISGFFINRDTDWQVVVEGTNTTEEVSQ